MQLAGKVVLVTGGARRLGRAICLALAAAGSHLFIHYGRSEAAAHDVAAQATTGGVQAAVYSADLADASATQTIMPAAVAHFGQIDILINNAALFLPGGLTETTLADWERQMAVNLRAPFLLSRAFAAQLPPDQNGKIINIGDARVFRPAADHAAYRLTKAALLAMTENLACELAPRITVNALALGAMLPPADQGEAYLEQLVRAEVPLQWSGGPASTVANVLHLLRDDFLTGVTIRVDGGQFL
jgi:glucose 1-dehydrogenase